MSFVEEHPLGTAFRVYVQPRSSKNAIVGHQGDALKVKIKALPVAGAANEMCIQFLAKSLGVPKSSLEILSGRTSRVKRLLLRYSSESLTDKQKARERRLVESLSASPG